MLELVHHYQCLVDAPGANEELTKTANRFAISRSRAFDFMIEGLSETRLIDAVAAGLANGNVFVVQDSSLQRFEISSSSREKINAVARRLDMQRRGVGRWLLSFAHDRGEIALLVREGQRL